MTLDRFKLLRRIGKPVVSAFALFMALTAAAQSLVPGKPQITQAIDPAQTVRIAGSVYPGLARATDLGAVRGDLALQRMVLVLKPSPEREAALTQLLDDQQNVKSARYRQWLTSEQFGQQYGPDATDIATVQAWLQSQGMSVTGVARGGWWIQFSGTSAQVSQAFGTSIHSYRLNGQVHSANASSISIPAALSPAVAGVLSLHNFPKLPNHTNVQRVVRSSNGQLAPAGGSGAGGAQPQGTFGGGTHYIAPGDMAAIYDTNPLLKQGINGTGVAIAVIGQTDANWPISRAFAASSTCRRTTRRSWWMAPTRASPAAMKRSRTLTWSMRVRWLRRPRSCL